MNMLRRSAVALAFVVIAVGAIFAQDRRTQRPREQTLFSEEFPIEHPIPLPADVLSILLKTKEVTDELKSASDSQRKSVAGSFRASEVHLGGADEADLIVAGLPPMRGADNDWFWVVASARRNPKVVLFAGGSSVELMADETLGYRNIRCMWYSASYTHTAVYHFDGKKYKLWKEKTTENPR